MNFGAPTFFYALAAIGIPIIIHLWSKNTKSKVPFGSLKFLKETETKTTRHLFPSELLLLVVRILLVASLIALFTQPFIFKPAESKTAHLLDVNLDQETLEKIKNDLQDKTVFWLSSERISVEEPITIRNIDTWLTLEQFSDFDSLVVYSQNLQSLFLSNQQLPSSKINWVQLPMSGVQKKIDQIHKGNTSFDLLLSASGDHMKFDLQQGTTGEVLIQNVFIQADPEHEKLANRIETAIRAMNNTGVITFDIKRTGVASKPSPDDWVIWLRNDKPALRKKLIYLNSLANGLEKESGIIYGLSPKISLDEMLLTNLPLQLETAMLEPLNQSLDSYDIRTIPDAYLLSGTASGVSGQVKHGLLNWAIGLFLSLFLLERLLSQVVIKK